ncbi:DUF4403 family protein [Algoriphagus namhaensis]
MHFQIRYRSLCHSLLYLALLSGFFACKSALPISSPGELPSPPEPRSSVNVPLQIPAGTLTSLMNSQIPIMLYQIENSSLGNGLEGTLNLRRTGPLTWSAVDSQMIQLTVPLQITGEVGLERTGLGNLIKGKIPIDERFQPTFAIDPVILPNWSVGVESFELIDLGGELGLNLMGMELDLSGVLRKQIQKWAAENLVAKPSVANLKPLVDLAWAQAGKPIVVQWQGMSKAFSIQPTQAKLFDYFDSQGNFNLWLGLDGKINTHPADAAPSRAFPLPNLQSNSDSTNRLEIILPVGVSYEQLDRLLQENLGNRIYRVDKKTTFIPSNFKSQAYGDRIGVEMDFSAEKSNGKQLEGKIFLVGKPAFDQKSESLLFEDINFRLESDSFQARTGAGLKRNKIIRQLEKRAQFPLDEIIEEGLAAIQGRLALQTPLAKFQIQDLKISPSGFYPQSSSFLIYLKASGRVAVDFN